MVKSNFLTKFGVDVLNLKFDGGTNPNVFLKDPEFQGLILQCQNLKKDEKLKLLNLYYLKIQKIELPDGSPQDERNVGCSGGEAIT